MRTIEVNALTQTGHIDFSPQLNSFILHLLSARYSFGASIDLCIHCDPFYCSFFYAIAPNTPT